MDGGTVIVAGLGIAGTLIGVFGTARLQERRDAIDTERRRADFQRTTLLELQDVIGDLARAAAQTNLEDTKNHRSSGKPFGTELVGDEIAEAQRVAGQRMMALSTRVLHDDVRELTRELSNASTAVGFSKSESESISHMRDVVERATQLNLRIGRYLRELL